MAFDRCFFMPYRRDQVGDFIAEVDQIALKAVGGKVHHARRMLIVCYDDAGKPLEKLGFALDTRISIVGHGKAGRPYISNSTGQGQKEYVPYNIVCDRMIERGLQKRYAGAISCDICYSAVKNDRNPSFADLVARYLTTKGFLLMHTIGYTGSMNTVPEIIPGKHKYEHRPVDVGGTTIKTSDWDGWKHYSGLRFIPTHLKNLAAANDNCPNF
jgi:hypothetical protein